MWRKKKKKKKNKHASVRQASGKSPPTALPPAGSRVFSIRPLSTEAAAKNICRRRRVQPPRLWTCLIFADRPCVSVSLLQMSASHSGKPAVGARAARSASCVMYQPWKHSKENVTVPSQGRKDLWLRLTAIQGGAEARVWTQPSLQSVWSWPPSLYGSQTCCLSIFLKIEEGNRGWEWKIRAKVKWECNKRSCETGPARPLWRCVASYVQFTPKLI